MWPAFENALTRHTELETLLADSAVIADRARYTKLAKEHGALLKMVKPYVEYRKLTDDIAQAEALVAEADPDMRALIEEELQALRPRQQELHTRLEDLLLAEGEDFGSIIMEIRAGTGGDEAAIFAGDLYRMYMQYAREKNWKVEEISFGPGEQGGYKEIVISITGDEVFQNLRYESGGHRVQRVPKTETQGRIHTSAATVAVLPEPDEVQVDVKDSEIEWERMRAGGAGGQHVNKTEALPCASGTSGASGNRRRNGSQQVLQDEPRASTRTTTAPCVSCAAGSMNASSRPCTTSARRRGAPSSARATAANASAPTITRKIASPTTASI